MSLYKSASGCPIADSNNSLIITIPSQDRQSMIQCNIVMQLQKRIPRGIVLDALEL